MTVEWFCANIPYECTEDEVREFILQSGALVSRVRLIHEYETGKFRGFAFADVDVAGGSVEEEAARRSIFGKKLTAAASNRSLPIHVERSRNPRRAAMEESRCRD